MKKLNLKKSETIILIIIIIAFITLIATIVIDLSNKKKLNEFKSYVYDVYELILEDRKEEKYEKDNMKLILTDSSEIEYSVKFEEDKMIYLCVSNGTYVFEKALKKGINKIDKEMLQKISKDSSSCIKKNIGE